MTSENELFLKPILLTHWYHNFILFILMTTSKWWISKTKEIYFFVKTHFAKLYIFIAFQVKWVLVMIGKHFKDKTCVVHLKFDWNIWSLQEIVDNYIIFKLRTKLVAEVLYSYSIISRARKKNTNIIVRSSHIKIVLNTRMLKMMTISNMNRSFFSLKYTLLKNSFIIKIADNWKEFQFIKI